ncbi:hypothetical protein J7L68_00105 [bacterium]|nr:hypothetical protein [bacterium]
MEKISQEYLEKAEHEVEEDFQDEKLQKMLGSLGGKPTKKDKFFNIVFLVLVIGLFAIELFWRRLVGTVALDFAILLISLKLIYLMHSQARVNHYQFWILTAIEMKTTMLLEQMQKSSIEYDKDEE